MEKVNCWEFKKCGRQPGGDKVVELGQCKAAINDFANGMNNGINAGRVCWAVSGTLCGGEVQGLFATKASSCLDCDFFKHVLQDEGKALMRLSTILSTLREHDVFREDDSSTTT